MTEATNNEALENLAEFIEARGAGDTFYQWARAVYKYGIGSWAVMVVEDTPARDIEYTIKVKPNANDEAELASSRLGIPARVIDFFGLAEDDKAYAYDAYYDLLVDYHQTGDGGVGTFEYSRNFAIDDSDEIIITGTYHMNATTRDIYYEDAEANTDVSEISPKVIGIRCGSIIEGADYDATPFYLEFPFTMEEFNSAMSDLELEVSEEWKKNNTTYYSISDDSGEKVYWCGWEAFDDGPTGNFEPSDDPFALKVAIAGGNMLFNGDSGAIEGFPGYSVKEEVMDW